MRLKTNKKAIKTAFYRRIGGIDLDSFARLAERHLSPMAVRNPLSLSYLAPFTCQIRLLRPLAEVTAAPKASLQPFHYTPWHSSHTFTSSLSKPLTTVTYYDHLRPDYKR